jgi:hypothetical protein
MKHDPSTDPDWGATKQVEGNKKRTDDQRGQFPLQTKSVKRNKREAFVRLGNARLMRVTKAMRVLGALANPSAYEFSKHDVEAISDHLAEEQVKILGKFKAALDRQGKVEEAENILR